MRLPDSIPSAVNGSVVTDTGRLRALAQYDILDTPAEPTYDRLSALAAHLFDAPIALITLIDGHRQWFKSTVGADWEETGLDVSFCVHCIQGDDVMVVPDARQDERFATNPFVTGPPGIRLYVGAPLIAPGGHRLGTICVIDTEPRRRPPDALLEQLETLASVVVDEMELRRAKAEAEEMNRLKSAFLANMSHEIRTPLTSIIGFAELIAEAPAMAGEFAGSIYQSGQRLLSTLNSVLDLAQLESGSMRIELERVDVKTEAQQALDQMWPQAQQKALALSLDAPSGPVHAWADASALRRILDNVLSNAVKFTKKGRVTIALASDARHTTIAVRDTGVGMSASFQDEMFEAFRQESTGNSRTFQGTGLGLAIVKRLTERLHGTVEVDSTQGEGTTVTVTLPRTAHASAAGPGDASAAGANCAAAALQQPRVLLVDDHDQTRELIPVMLGRHAQVEAVASAQEAIERAQAETYDLFLVDINLGEGQSGLDVVRVLRQQASYQDTPFIACTTFAMNGDRERLLDAGFDAYLPKPFDREQLQAALRTALEPNTQATPQLSTFRPSPHRTL